MGYLTQFLETAVTLSASDIHLVAGELPMVRVNGALQEIGKVAVSQEALLSAITEILDERQKALYEKEHELDLGYGIGTSRFRLNIHQQEGKIALAGRLILDDIPTPDMLQFTPAMKAFSGLLDGLVLVVGPTGSGKSTTIASLVEHINQTRRAHIITIEDPIEFTFKNAQSLVEQREVGEDTPSFASALKHVLRQDPDVIVVGEMRDPETIAMALTAAETGHLVFSTLHTSTAAEAVERIVDVFEGTKQKQILIQLGAVLRAVVAQQLVPGIDGKQIAAREILINTPAVANLIRENNISQIDSVIQTNAKLGMMTMEQSLGQLVENGIIDAAVAQKRGGHQRME